MKARLTYIIEVGGVSKDFTKDIVEHLFPLGTHIFEFIDDKKHMKVVHEGLSYIEDE